MAGNFANFVTNTNSSNSTGANLAANDQAICWRRPEPNPFGKPGEAPNVSSNLPTSGQLWPLGA